MYQEQGNLVRLTLLVMLCWLIFGTSLPVNASAGRSLDCYECGSTLHSNIHKEANNRDCAGTPVYKKYLVNRTKVGPQDWLRDQDNVICEVTLFTEDGSHWRSPEMHHGFTRDLRTDHYYKNVLFSNMPLEMRPGEKFRCVQQSGDHWQWKKCYCFTNACNDMLTFEKLLAMKITDKST